MKNLAPLPEFNSKPHLSLVETAPQPPQPQTQELASRALELDAYVKSITENKTYSPDPYYDSPIFAKENTPTDAELTPDTIQRLAVVEPQLPQLKVVSNRRIGVITPGDKLNEKFPPTQITEYKTLD